MMKEDVERIKQVLGIKGRRERIRGVKDDVEENETEKNEAARGREDRRRAKEY
jgi:hypothetical protein